MILADFSISFKVIENAMTTKPSVYENMKKINQMLFTVNISHEHNQTQEFPALVILCESVVVCVRAYVCTKRINAVFWGGDNENVFTIRSGLTCPIC